MLARSSFVFSLSISFRNSRNKSKSLTLKVNRKNSKEWKQLRLRIDIACFFLVRIAFQRKYSDKSSWCKYKSYDKWNIRRRWMRESGDGVFTILQSIWFKHFGLLSPTSDVFVCFWALFGFLFLLRENFIYFETFWQMTENAFYLFEDDRILVSASVCDFNKLWVGIINVLSKSARHKRFRLFDRRGNPPEDEILFPNRSDDRLA